MSESIEPRHTTVKENNSLIEIKKGTEPLRSDSADFERQKTRQASKIAQPTISAKSAISIKSVKSVKSSVKSIKSTKSVAKVKSGEIRKSNLRLSSKQSDIQIADEPPIHRIGRSNQLPVYTKSDSSVYPSYSNLILPYRVVCRQRYQNAINKHHEQFIKEIRLHERLQPYALGGVRLRREFCDPILVKVGFRDIIGLTIEEERRLEHILKTDPKEL